MEAVFDLFFSSSPPGLATVYDRLKYKGMATSLSTPHVATCWKVHLFCALKLTKWFVYAPVPADAQVGEWTQDGNFEKRIITFVRPMGTAIGT